MQFKINSTTEIEVLRHGQREYYVQINDIGKGGLSRDAAAVILRRCIRAANETGDICPDWDCRTWTTNMWSGKEWFFLEKSNRRLDAKINKVLDGLKIEVTEDHNI